MPQTLQGLLTVAARAMLALIFLMSAVGNKIPNFSKVASYMSSEGVRGMPDDSEEESTILPDGNEVPPGLYSITMTLTGSFCRSCFPIGPRRTAPFSWRLLLSSV